MAKAYRFVRTGTCACALRAGPGVIMPPDARLPDRPLGSAHGGDCNRGLRRHRDRFRAQLPAVAQRRGRDAVGGLAPIGTRRAGRRHRRPPRPAAALPGRARVAGAARRHAGAASALRAVRHPRHRARLRLRSRAAGPIRRRRAGGAGRDHPGGGAPRPVRARVHRHAGRLLRQHVAAAAARAHAPRPLRRALRRVGAAAGGRAPVRPVRPGVGDGAAGGAGPGAAAARLALAAPEPDRAEPGSGNGAPGDAAAVACVLPAAAQVRRRSGRGGGRPRVVGVLAPYRRRLDGLLVRRSCGWRWPLPRWPGS